MHTERFGSYMDNRILIVEDEEKIARFLELELRHEGYDVDKASNGRDGLDKALTKNRHEPYINRRTFHIIGILYRIWKGRRVPQ